MASGATAVEMGGGVATSEVLSAEEIAAIRVNLAGYIALRLAESELNDATVGEVLRAFAKDIGTASVARLVEIRQGVVSLSGQDLPLLVEMAVPDALSQKLQQETAPENLPENPARIRLTKRSNTATILTDVPETVTKILGEDALQNPRAAAIALETLRLRGRAGESGSFQPTKYGVDFAEQILKAGTFAKVDDIVKPIASHLDGAALNTWWSRQSKKPGAGRSGAKKYIEDATAQMSSGEPREVYEQIADLITNNPAWTNREILTELSKSILKSIPKIFYEIKDEVEHRFGDELDPAAAALAFVRIQDMDETYGDDPRARSSSARARIVETVLQSFANGASISEHELEVELGCKVSDLYGRWRDYQKRSGIRVPGMLSRFNRSAEQLSPDELREIYEQAKRDKAEEQSREPAMSREANEPPDRTVLMVEHDNKPKLQPAVARQARLSRTAKTAVESTASSQILRETTLTTDYSVETKKPKLSETAKKFLAKTKDGGYVMPRGDFMKASFQTLRDFETPELSESDRKLIFHLATGAYIGQGTEIRQLEGKTVVPTEPTRAAIANLRKIWFKVRSGMSGDDKVVTAALQYFLDASEVGTASRVRSKLEEQFNPYRDPANQKYSVEDAERYIVAGLSELFAACKKAGQSAK